MRNGQVRKFNPGVFQSDEEVKAQYVIRDREFRRVLQVLRENIDSPSCQHLLIVGPRGRGKTMMLARVAAEIRTSGELFSRLLPVRFMEESLEILTLADFWMETLFYLAGESTPFDAQVARELSQTHVDLSRRRDHDLAERARMAVLEAASRLGRKLVLMVENLQGLCKNTGEDFGWQLRQVLQTDPQIMLLASATSRFKHLDDARQPFFELFRIFTLEPLTTSECRHLWQAISGDTTEREIRPLQILTGGSPRLMVMVAEFARYRSLPRLMENLVSLIDQHTEYFRSHLEALPPTERRVYVALLDLWQPSTTAQLAERARMDVRTVSTMLGRLVGRGAATVDGTGKKRVYDATERLYGIYYKLRRERDDAAVVEHLVRFMTVFYSESEVSDLLLDPSMEVAESRSLREGVLRAVTGHPHFNDVVSAMLLESVRNALDAFNEQSYEMAIECLDQAFRDDEAYWRRAPPKIVGLVHLVKAAAQATLGKFDESISTLDALICSADGDDRLDFEDTVLTAFALKGYAQADAGDLRGAIATLHGAIRRYGTSNESDFGNAFARLLIAEGFVLTKLGDFEAAIAAYDRVVDRLEPRDEPERQGLVAQALGGRGNAMVRRGDYEAAIGTFDKALDLFGAAGMEHLPEDAAKAFIGKGNALLKLGDFDGAIRAYERVTSDIVRQAPDNADLRWWGELATVDTWMARRRLGRTYLASICEAFANLADDSDKPIIKKLWVGGLARWGIEQARVGRMDEAVQAREELEQRLGSVDGAKKAEGEWAVGWIRTKEFLNQGRLSAAVDAFDNALGAFAPGTGSAVGEALEIVLDLVAGGASAQNLADLLSSDSARAVSLMPLVVALRQHSGESEQASVEVLHVASDIRERIDQRVAQRAFSARPQGQVPGDLS